MINEYALNDAIRTLIIMSISGGIVAVLLFALKPLVRNHLPKSAQYYLWLVAVAALLVPVSVFVKLPTTTENAPIIMSPSNVVERYFITGEEEMDRMGVLDSYGAREVSNPIYMQAVKEAESPITGVVTFFPFIYPLGVLIALLYYIINYSVFVRLYCHRNTAATADEIVMFAEMCGSKRTPLLYRNPLAATPMLIGVFRPAIILPDKEYTDVQLHAVLLHELTHLRRKDVLVKWLSVIVTAVHWFNPIVWLMRREIDRACELSCDEAVIRNLDTNGKQNYGETLLYVAADSKTPHAVLSTTMCEEKKALKERLGAIMKSKKHTRLAVILSVVMILAVGGTAIALGAGKVDTLKEPPSITIKAGDMDIEWVIGLNKWNGRVYDRLDNFQALMDGKKINDLVYAPNGELITIEFSGSAPQSATLTEFILTPNGYEKYSVSGMDYEIRITSTGYPQIGFTVKPNYATALSSSSEDYIPGNTIKGYRFVCDWDGNECEYAFIICGDAVMAIDSAADIVTVIIYKDVDGNTAYSLFGGDVIPAPSELSRGRVFNDVADLNAVLAEYPQDALSLVHVRHTMDFTKDEMQIISDMIKIPSDNYSKSVGYYEFHITTLDEAREIVKSHYPNAVERSYPNEDIISYTNPPAPVEVYSFEIDADGVTVICAVSKERGIFFTYKDETWFAFTGLLEWSGATKNMTLDDVRAISQKIGTDLTMGDLRDFIGTDVGSGLYVMQYFIEDSDYMLIVGSGDMNTVAYANLIYATDGGYNESIDIRYYDVDGFIKDKTKVIIRGTPPSYTDSGVNVIVHGISSSGIAIALENTTEKEYSLGESYSLYVRKNDSWESVKPITENWGFDSIGYTLAPRTKTKVISIDWMWLYGELTEGEYKFQKEILFSRSSGDYDTFTLEADFTISAIKDENSVVEDEHNSKQQSSITFWVKPDEPAQVIGEVAASQWLNSYKNANMTNLKRIDDYNIDSVDVAFGSPLPGQSFQDMAYNIFVHVNYGITTASEEYLSPGDGVSGKGTFEGLSRVLYVKKLENGNFEIVGEGSGGGVQEYVVDGTDSDNRSNGKTDNAEIDISDSNNFSSAEIEEAINCIKNKFVDFEGCELMQLWYDEVKSDAFIEGYMTGGHGAENGVIKENVIVLLSNFKVDSSGGDGSLNPNSTYSNWNWILIRDSKTDKWKVDDWGY